MGKNIGLFINLTLLFITVKNTISVCTLLLEVLVQGFWIDTIICVIFIIILGLVGAFSIDNIIKIINKII